MKILILTFLSLLLAVSMNAQKTDSLSTAIYHPEADASLQIREAMTRAKKENKHVFLQIGGNWCTWCRRFNNLVTTNDTLETLLTNQYVVAHINYSPENKNLPVLATLGYPQRFGFPVFVILDANGQRLHTQNSGYLEEGKGHSVKKIADFLKDWSPSALDAHKYE